MTAHGGDDEGLRALRLQPATDGANNLLQAGNAAASHGNRDAPATKLFRRQSEPGQVGLNGSTQIVKRRAARRLSLQKVEVG